MYPAAISFLLRRWSTCYLTEPFTRHEVVMQKNSCIKLSFIFLAGFAEAFTYSLGAWISIMLTLKFPTHVSVLIKNPGESRGSSIMKSEKLTKPCKVFQMSFLDT